MNSIAEKILNSNNLKVDVKTDLKIDELKKIIPEYDGLIVRSATKVTKEIIDIAKNLKIIGRAGAGVDNIDLEYAKNKGILVMNTPGGNTNATAEHTFSLILSVYRNITEANISTHKGLWEKKKFKGLELRDKCIGLIGFGNVASRVAEISQGFNMKVITYSKSFENRKNQFPYVESVELNELLINSDIISFHCKLPKDGKSILYLNDLKKMKNKAIIVNTARGNLINESDLKTALNESIIMGAGLDVFSDEPATDNILFNTKNLILTPHIAASTFEAQLIVAKKIAEQISDFFINNKISNSL